MNEILKNNDTQGNEKREKKGVNFSSIENKVNEIEGILGNVKDGKEFYVNNMNKIIAKELPGSKLIINNGKIELKTDIGKEDLNAIIQLLEKNNSQNSIDKTNLDLNKSTTSQLLNENQKQISMGNVNYLKDLLLKKEGENKYEADFKDNVEAELHIGLADILPNNVRKVRIQGEYEGENYDLTGTRIGDKGGFYSDKHDYLPIYHGFKITVIEEWDENQLKNSKDKLSKDIEEFKNTEFYKSSIESFDEKTLDKLVKSALEYNISPINFIGLYKLKNQNTNNFGQINSGIDSTDAQLSLTGKKIQQCIGEYYKVGGKNVTLDGNEMSPEFILFMKQLHPNWLNGSNEKVLKTITNKEYSQQEINTFRGNINEQIININNIYTNNGENQDIDTSYGDLQEGYEGKYNPREIFSEPFERSPSGCTLCGKTARLNYMKFGGKCKRGDAISLVNDPEYNGGQVHKRTRALFLLESGFNDKSYYHVSVAKNDGKNGREEARNGHSFVVFKGNDGETYVLDPYYFGGSNKPHKLSQHPLTYNMKYGNSKWAIHNN